MLNIRNVLGTRILLLAIFHNHSGIPFLLNCEINAKMGKSTKSVVIKEGSYTNRFVGLSSALHCHLTRQKSKKNYWIVEWIFLNLCILYSGRNGIFLSQSTWPHFNWSLNVVHCSLNNGWIYFNQMRWCFCTPFNATFCKKIVISDNRINHLQVISSYGQIHATTNISIEITLADDVWGELNHFKKKNVLRPPSSNICKSMMFLSDITPFDDINGQNHYSDVRITSIQSREKNQMRYYSNQTIFLCKKCWVSKKKCCHYCCYHIRNCQS